VRILNIEKYKEKYHFSVNFYSLFLIATFIPDIVGIDNILVKYSYWVIKVFLACLIIVKDKRNLLSMSRLEFMYVCLVFLYGVIIFVDVFVAPDEGLARSDTFFLTGVTDWLGFCLGVLIAFSFRYDHVYHSETSFLFFWISLTIALILSYFLSFQSFDLDVVNGRYDANSTINSIMYGQTGCAMALISILGIVNNKRRLWKALFIFTFVLGIVSIGKAGSRSPIIVLAIVGIFYFIARVGVVRSVMLVTLVVGLIYVFINQIIAFLELIGSSLIPRLASMVFENDSSGRDGIYSNAWSLIKDSPFLGSFYVIKSGIGAGGYPHNFILEVFLATGMIGGIPFVILLFVNISRCFRIIKNRHESSWIAVLYLQIIVYGMFSTGLYTSQDFWVLSFFIVSMNKAVFKSIVETKPFSMAINPIEPKLN
jgi:O-antigen ligase